MKSVPAYSVRIYVSAPMNEALQVCREFCRRGLCVTVERTTFVYTGGEEAGVVVGLVNYPRFPSTPEAIWTVAVELADLLAERCFQDSVLVIDATTCEWRTKRTA